MRASSSFVLLRSYEKKGRSLPVTSSRLKPATFLSSARQPLTTFSTSSTPSTSSPYTRWLKFFVSSRMPVVRSIISSSVPATARYCSASCCASSSWRLRKWTMSSWYFLRCSWYWRCCSERVTCTRPWSRHSSSMALGRSSFSNSSNLRLMRLWSCSIKKSSTKREFRNSLFLRRSLRKDSSMSRCRRTCSALVPPNQLVPYRQASLVPGQKSERTARRRAKSSQLRWMGRLSGCTRNEYITQSGMRKVRLTTWWLSTDTQRSFPFSYCRSAEGKHFTESLKSDLKTVSPSQAIFMMFVAGVAARSSGQLFFWQGEGAFSFSPFSFSFSFSFYFYFYFYFLDFYFYFSTFSAFSAFPFSAFTSRISSFICEISSSKLGMAAMLVLSVDGSVLLESGGSTMTVLNSCGLGCGCDQKSKLVKSTLDFVSLLLHPPLPTPAELQNSLLSKALNLPASSSGLLPEGWEVSGLTD